MKNVVKILTEDSPNGTGEKYENPKWCYIQNWGDGLRTLCTGEVFGIGESSCEYKIKPLIRGAITCDKCKTIINEIKSIPL